MRLFKFPPPSYFLTLVLFLFASLFFLGCKKTGDVIKKELPENISKQELLLWINNYQKLMPGGPKPILEQTLKTYYRGQMILKMPLSSGGGNLYFTKSDHLEVQFIRIVSADDQIKTPFNGYYEFINMNTYEYKKIIFKQGVRQAEVNNSLPKQQAIKNTSTIQSTETWLGAFLRCIAEHIIAIPRRDIYGNWGCYGLGGGSNGEVLNLAPPESGSGGLGGDGPVITIGGGAGPGIDWLNWFNSINWPGLPPSYPDGGGNTGGDGSFYSFIGDGGNDPSNSSEVVNPLPTFLWTFLGDDGTSFVDLDPSKETFFQFDSTDNYELNYPRFTSMVKNLKTFVKNNPKVLNALQFYSGFTKQKILDYLTFGQGPKIKIEEMSGIFGYYNKEVSSNTLHLRASYVRGLEIAHLQSTQDATSFLLAVTILHEFVHLGTNQNNISEGGYDFGLGFERDAFNVIVDETNSSKIVVRFSKYF